VGRSSKDIRLRLQISTFVYDITSMLVQTSNWKIDLPFQAKSIPKRFVTIVCTGDALESNINTRSDLHHLQVTCPNNSIVNIDPPRQQQERNPSIPRAYAR
jgi:hypothetical protein